MKAREAKSELLCSGGDQLIAAKHPSSADIQSRIKSLQQHWKVLRELADNRRKQLEEAMEAYQVNFNRIQVIKLNLPDVLLMRKNVCSFTRMLTKPSHGSTNDSLW